MTPPETRWPPSEEARSAGGTSARGEREDGPGAGIDLGVLVARSPEGEPAALESFADRIAGDAADELSSVTASAWRAHVTEPAPLADGRTRRPSAFFDEAALRMVEGPYDLIAVVTDVPLVSRRQRLVPGLASPIGRVVVVSTRKLLVGPRDEPIRSLSSDAVRWNATALLLHLLGHVLGAGHRTADGGVMEPFEFDPARRRPPSFDADVSGHLRRIATRVPDEAVSRGPLRRLAFHVSSAWRNAGKVLRVLVHSRAPLLPLSLPKLAAAAVTPTLILVFSAEAWDVGVNMTDGVVVLFASASVVAAAVHLTLVHNLLFPRRPSQVITEHMALVNVTAFLTLLLAMVGLFALVGSIILVIELVVFPPDLMTNWPSLEEPTIGSVDLVRIGAFISTIGVLSGALAGGIEDRTLIRHLALFLDRP